MSVLLFSVLSLDGCVSDSSGETKWGINYHKLGVVSCFENADCEISVPLSIQEIKDSHTSFIIEATDRNIDYVVELMKAGVVNEIVLLILPYIAGSGKQLLGRCRISSYWELMESLPLESGILITRYRRMHFDGENAV